VRAIAEGLKKIFVEIKDTARREKERIECARIAKKSPREQIEERISKQLGQGIDGVFHSFDRTTALIERDMLDINEGRAIAREAISERQSNDDLIGVAKSLAAAATQLVKKADLLEQALLAQVCFSLSNAADELARRSRIASAASTDSTYKISVLEAAKKTVSAW
jgi:hypothetical protein